MPVNAKELADILGVSPSAISIALNNRKGISEATRKRILDAAQEYDLQVGPARHTSKNLKAAAPVYLVKLLIYRKYNLVNDEMPFFAMLLSSITNTCTELGMSLQLCYIDDDNDLDIFEQFNNLATPDCAGFLLLATEMSPQDFAPLADYPLPIVMIDNHMPQYNVDSISINNIQGTYQSTKLLLDQGHTELCYLHSSIRITNFCERLEGIQKAIAEHPNANRVHLTSLCIGSTIQMPYPIVEEYLRQNAVIPTGYIADDDVLALPCMQAFLAHGFKIPEDLSIVGFDNAMIGQLTYPQLTTIDVPKMQLASYAVRKLYERITGQSDADVRFDLRLNTTLILRDSVGPCRR